MFSKITPCYKRCLNPNEILYLQVKNECPYYIYVVLEYKVKHRKTKRQSPVFSPGKSECLTFPSYAIEADFEIFSCFHNPPVRICAKGITTSVSSCYKVVGATYAELQCVYIPC